MQQRGNQGPRRQRHAGPQFLSNLQSLFCYTTPLVPQFQEEAAAASSSYFTLRDLWQQYEEWSAFGCEVPMRVNVAGRWEEIVMCYVPQLSGMQLFGADHARRIVRPAAAASPTAAGGGYCSDEEGACGSPASAAGAPANSCSSACTSSTASTAGTDSDSEGDGKDSPTCSGANGGAGRSSAATAARTDRGSVLGKQRNLGEPSQALFEFFETASPHTRVPLSERIEQLAEACPELLSLDTRELHPASWFSVAWYPIYRLPNVADSASARELQSGAFLTYHSLSVPPQRLGAQQDWCSTCPQPPPLCVPAAAALAWRGELARQQLLSAALAATSAGTTAAAESLAGLCLEPSEVPPPTPAAPTPRQLPLGVAVLAPFGFVPYKVMGRTWVDDWNLQRAHLPMITAASAWVERRRCQHPDFDFFSSMYRPLPTMQR